MYAVRLEGLSSQVYDLAIYLVVTCNGETYVAAAEPVTHRNFLQSTVAFILEVRGVKVITCTFKIAKFCCSDYCTGYRSNRTLIQEPV